MFHLIIEVFNIYYNRLNTTTYRVVKTSLNAKDALRNILYHYHSTSFAEIYGEGYEAVNFNHYYFVFEAIKEFPELNENFLSVTNEFSTLVNSIVIDGVISGEIRKETDVEAVVYEVGVMIEGFTAIASVMKDDANDQMLERIFELFWRGISA